MALVKEIHVGPERGYCCAISRAVFTEGEYGSREAARKACLRHAYETVRESDLPAGASIRQRRAEYRNSKSPAV